MTRPRRNSAACLSYENGDGVRVYRTLELDLANAALVAAAPSVPVLPALILRSPNHGLCYCTCVWRRWEGSS